MAFNHRILLFSLTTALLVGGAFFALNTETAKQKPNPLQPLWLAAEMETQPKLAAQKWEQLSKAIAQSPADIDTGIPAASVPKMLFTAYLNAADWLNAEAMIEQWQGREKMWAKLLLAQSLIPTDSHHAWDFIASAAQDAMALTHEKQRSYALHAIVSVALTHRPSKDKTATHRSHLVFPWDGPQLAEKLIPQILSPWHRADALHSLALVSKNVSSALPQALQNALRIPLAEEKKRNQTLLNIHQVASSEELFYPALDALSGIADANLQQKALYEVSQQMLELKEYSHAIDAAERLDYDRRGAIAWGRLAVFFAQKGQTTRMEAALARCNRSAALTHYEDDRAEAEEAAAKYSLVAQRAFKKYQHEQRKQQKKALKSAPLKQALAALKKNNLRDAVDLLKATPDARLRAQQFRILAQEQAKLTDYYHLLHGKAEKQFLTPTEKTQSNALSVSAENALEDSISQKSTHKKSKLDLRTLPASSLGNTLPPLPLAEHLALTAASMQEKLPLPTPAVIRRVHYANSYFIYTKFKVAINEAKANLREGIITPEIIFLERGNATLPQIYDALRAQGINNYLTKVDNIYTLRRGLVVGQNASLTIEGGEVEELRQSIDYGAILVNAGTLHINNTRLVSWDEETGDSSRREYPQKYDFRPFISSWSGSHSYISGSEFLDLGYAKSKSFSLTFTTGPKKMVTTSLFKAKRPEAEVVDNSFINAYYGFYSYEADKIALIGNEYRDNIVYGIDPHDRSRDLTIAYNTAYDSQQKHGIIISREVNDSSYIGNLSFDNKGSGFMLDRKSTGTYIYGNTAFGNKQDGLTVFESSCNLIASNHFFENQSVGIRFRNSQDNGLFFNRIAANKKVGILGYSSRLEDLASQSTRNFTMDPYSNIAAMTLIGNHISANGVGLSIDKIHALTLRGNQFEEQSPKLMQGDWFRELPYLSSQYNLDKDGAIITDTCPESDWSPYTCRFRQSGYFSGDGQRDLFKRVIHSPCHPSHTQAKS
jgi:hypothetical protein